MSRSASRARSHATASPAGGSGAAGPPASTARVHGGPDALGPVHWDFSTNVNAAGPCPAALRAVAQADATRYPDPLYTALRERLAALHGVAVRRIVLAASASEFIQRITAAAARVAVATGVEPALRPGPVSMPAFAYGDYAAAAQAWGRECVGPNAVDAALRWCCDPSSPLGQREPPPADPAERPTVLDSAYAPLRLDGAVGWPREARDAVFQLFSPNKALGLPGVRGAYAIAPLEAAWPVRTWCEALDGLQPSWPLGAHAVALLDGWCDAATQRWLADSLSVLRTWTADLRSGLAQLGLEPAASVTPFLCARRPEAATPAWLRARGLAVRDTASFGLPGWMRVSAQPPPALAALLTALVEAPSRRA